MTVEVRTSHAGRVEDPRFGVRAIWELFAKLALAPVRNAFRRIAWDLDRCDKHSHFNMFPRGTREGSVDTLKVRDARDVEQAVRAAIAGEQPLEIIGHGSKRLIGQPMATNALLDLSALNAVTSYEPNELIITVQAGAPLADVRR